MRSELYQEPTFSGLHPGDHLCYIYENEQQRANVILSYLLDGLEQRQKIIYLGTDPLPEMTLDIKNAAARGQFILIDDAPDPQAVPGLLEYQVESARADRFSALRLMIEPGRGAPSLDGLLDCEIHLNELPLADRAVVFCLYRRDRFPAEFLIDILAAHPRVLAGGLLCNNFYYLPPQSFREKSRASTCLDRCLDHLAYHHQVENALSQADASLKESEATLRKSETQLQASEAQIRQRLEAMVEEQTAELQRQIHERQRVEEVLRESEGRYRALVNQAPLSILVMQDGRYVFANPAIVQRLGYSSAYELIGKNVVDTIAAESRELFARRQELVLIGGSAQPVMMAFQCKDGGVYRSESTSVPIFYQGRPAELVIGQDVTERLRQEQQLKTSLSEKEVMLREIHHRVKNNLNVIIALIDLQKSAQKDAQVLQVFKDLQTRVNTMALVHESLYRSPNLAKIDTAGYLQTLVSYLYSAYSPLSGELARAPSAISPVSLRVEAVDVSLNIETAIPCGLIVNELVTNALKYAFPAGFVSRDPLGCRITVRLAQANGLNGDHGKNEPSEQWLKLTVSDNGVGIPPGFNWRTASSLGLQLVQVLSRQINGQIELEAKSGAAWSLLFTEKR